MLRAARLRFPTPIDSGAEVRGQAPSCCDAPSGRIALSWATRGDRKRATWPERLGPILSPLRAAKTRPIRLREVLSLAQTRYWSVVDTHKTSRATFSPERPIFLFPKSRIAMGMLFQGDSFS